MEYLNQPVVSFVSASQLSARKKADILVLPFFKDKEQVVQAASIEHLQSVVSKAIETKDFKGKEGEVVVLYDDGQPESRIALLGLGEEEKVTVEKLRCAYANIVKVCRSRRLQEINILPPAISAMIDIDVVRGISEGLLLPNYAFEKLKRHKLKEEKAQLLKKVTLIGSSKNCVNDANKYALIDTGIKLTRDLINGNADDITPQFLVEIAHKIGKDQKKIKVTTFDKQRMQKEGMGLLLAVNQGSSREPAFIIAEYKGNPKSKDHTILVGKGVTFDTGGLNLKPTGSMETMKADMSGAAIVLSTVWLAAKLKIPVNATAVIPTTENCIGSKSVKPGDVHISYSGKSVEIGNTDAEGRLILADAIAYACDKLKPSRIIDLATLTGAIIISLGRETIGLMSNNDALADALQRSGSVTYERLWRLPLYDEYKELLKSDLADISNVSSVREASSITAALFIQEFVEKNVPWAHLDIAGVEFFSSPKRYYPKHATAIGVRLLIDFLETL